MILRSVSAGEPVRLPLFGGKDIMAPRLGVMRDRGPGMAQHACAGAEVIRGTRGSELEDIMRRISILLCLGAAPYLAAQAPFGRVSTSPDAILVDGSPLFLQGVSYSPLIAGDVPGGPIRNVNFRDDLREIRDVLHANAVRIFDPMPEQFYREARDAGLWVIQGIFIPDSEAAGAVAPRFLLTPAFLAAQKERITDVVRRVNESGAEEVILAYVIGSALSSDAIRQTITSEVNQAAPRFAGTRYAVPPSTPIPPANAYPECGPPPLEAFPDPHPFQSFIAELAEHLAIVDEGMGVQRHLTGYANVPRNSSFLGARDRPAAVLDVPVNTGFLDVIFENVFTFDHAYVLYRSFSSYIERLKTAHPEKPVVILETGYSTSPTGLGHPDPLCGLRSPEPQPLHFQFGGTSEADQARGIEARWVDVITARRPLAGFFVREFYDEWWLGGNPEVQDDHPLEHFGLKRVVKNGDAVTSQPKPAHAKVAELFGCEGPGAPGPGCGLAIASGPVLEATFGLPLTSLALAATGGASPFTWEILPPDDLAPGPLPLGVSLDSSGSVSGTPERVGDFRLRVAVRDSGALERDRVVVLRVHPPVFSTRGRELLANGEPFFMKGIDYSPYIAGDAPWSAPLKANPYEDMEVIAGTLRANTIRVYQSLPRTVYDAARKNGLFVVQGIHLQIDGPSPGEPVACRNTDVDLLEPGFVERMKTHIISEIDEVHAAGGGDVVLCWVVGNEMNFCAQRKTIELHQEDPRLPYKGVIYSAPTEAPRLPCVNAYPGCPQLIEAFQDPHPVQSFVAELVDTAAVREVAVHGERRLMAHATDPNTSVAVCSRDRFDPELHLPVDLGFLDIVFQNVYSYFPPAIRFLGYKEYLEACAVAYPDTPFVILECGYSVSPKEDMPGCAAGPNCGQPMAPIPDSFCFGKNTKDEQAQGIEAQWRSATSTPGLVSGFFVFEYFDEWWKGHQHSEFVHDETKGEEWFGIVEVRGTPDDFTTERRPAFETVQRIFGEDVLAAGFRRGDTNQDGAVNITDGIAALNMLFLGAPLSPCPDALDADDSRAFNITDPIYILNHLFLGGPALPSPGIDSCGPDATDPEGACSYPAELCS